MDVAALKRNMATVDKVRNGAGCKIVLATKSFALPAVFPIMKPHLDGTTASGLFETQMGHDEFGKEVHVYSPAFTEKDVKELLPLATHFYFNSEAQLRAFMPLVKSAGKKIAIRVNPGYSKATLGGNLYDPCAPNSRFGVTQDKLDTLPWDDIDILHCHALCEADHNGSKNLIAHVAGTLSPYIAQVETVNFGGGHFINDKDYDTDVLIAAIKSFKETFPHVSVTLEPGGGIVRDTGYYATRIMDIVDNGQYKIAVIDGSVCNHMPDVLEVPYVPEIIGTTGGPHKYIIGGNTCMTGDLIQRVEDDGKIIAPYGFDAPLKPGDMLVMTDMMQYSFIKMNSFNGIRLPDLGMLHEDGRYEMIKSFGYDAFRGNLG